MRPQADYAHLKPQCTNCVAKVPGFSAVTKNGDGVWKPGQELNCGDQCSLVSLFEQRDAQGQAVQPRRIVGRSFRTAKPLSDMPDSSQLQALLYNDFTNLFVGLGLCCEGQPWCSAGCKGMGNSMVLVGWAANVTASEPAVLLKLADAADSRGLALGLAQSMGAWYGQPAGYYVLIDSKIVGFSVKADWTVADATTGVKITATIDHTSKPLDNPPFMWTGSRFYASDRDF